MNWKQFIELLLKSVCVNMCKNMLMFMSWDTKNCHIVANSKYCRQKIYSFLLHGTFQKYFRNKDVRHKY